MWGRGQSACRFVLCFRKNWGERYAAASVKPCKNCPPDSAPAPQKSLHSVNLPQTEASLSLSSAVFPVRRPPYCSTVSKLRFPPSFAHAKLAADGTPAKSFKRSFSRPPPSVLQHCFQTPFLPSFVNAKLAADGSFVKSFKRSFSRPPFTLAGGALRGLGQCRLVEFQNADDCRSPPPFCRRCR